MTVTEIQRTKKGRFSIYLDGEFYCALHMDVFALSDLKVGGPIDPDRMAELHRASEQRITRERALGLLGQRSYTEQGLYRKLCERTDEQSAAEAVSRMVELGLVDDADYARRFAADCINLKGFSHRRALQELVRKGIDRQVAEDALAELDEDPEPAIAAVALRKYRNSMNDEKGYQRTVNGLVRLGYRFEDIRTVLTNLLEDEDYYNK